jgi:hypothetical protein
MSHFRSRASLMRAAGAAVLTAATLTGGAQGIAQAAPARPADPGDRTVEVTVVNDADETSLDLVEGGRTRVTQGEWSPRPPSFIDDGDSAVFGTSSTADQGGTSARVTFDADDGQVRISWKNPWVGPNKITCSVPRELSCRARIDQFEAAQATVRISKR